MQQTVVKNITMVAKNDIYRRRNLSDEICKENGLSVIEHNNKNWQSYKEWEENKREQVGNKIKKYN
mgnify:CR=1 FL=1